MCSVLVSESGLQRAYELAEALRMRHFQTGEIKSNKVKVKDTERRVRILGDLAELPLKLYFTVVDKSRVYRDGGLQFKSPLSSTSTAYSMSDSSVTVRTCR